MVHATMRSSVLGTRFAGTSSVAARPPATLPFDRIGGGFAGRRGGQSRLIPESIKSAEAARVHVATNRAEMKDVPFRTENTRVSAVRQRHGMVRPRPVSARPPSSTSQKLTPRGAADDTYFSYTDCSPLPRYRRQGPEDYPQHTWDGNSTSTKTSSTRGVDVGVDRRASDRRAIPGKQPAAIVMKEEEAGPLPTRSASKRIGNRRNQWWDDCRTMGKERNCQGPLHARPSTATAIMSTITTSGGIVKRASDDVVRSAHIPGSPYMSRAEKAAEDFREIAQLRNEVGFWKSEAGLFKGEAIEAQRRLETQEGRISAVLRQTAEVLPACRYGIDLRRASGESRATPARAQEVAILEHRRELEKGVIVRRLKGQITELRNRLAASDEELARVRRSCQFSSLTEMLAAGEEYVAEVARLRAKLDGHSARDLQRSNSERTSNMRLDGHSRSSRPHVVSIPGVSGSLMPSSSSNENPPTAQDARDTPRTEGGHSASVDKLPGSGGGLTDSAIEFALQEGATSGSMCQSSSPTATGAQNRIRNERGDVDEQRPRGDRTQQHSCSEARNVAQVPCRRNPSTKHSAPPSCLLEHNSGAPDRYRDTRDYSVVTPSGTKRHTPSGNTSSAALNPDRRAALSRGAERRAGVCAGRVAASRQAHARLRAGLLGVSAGRGRSISLGIDAPVRGVAVVRQNDATVGGRTKDVDSSGRVAMTSEMEMDVMKGLVLAQHQRIERQRLKMQDLEQDLRDYRRATLVGREWPRPTITPPANRKRASAGRAAMMSLQLSRSAPAGLDRLSGSRGVDSSLREWTVDDALRGGCALLDRSDQESRCSTDNAIRKSYDQDRGQAGSDLLSRQTEGNLSRTPCDEPDSRTDSQLSMAHYSTAVAKDERDAGRRHGSGARSRNDPLGVIRPQSAGPRLYTGQPRARLEGTSWSAQSEDRRRTRKGRDGKYADDVDAPQSVLDKATKRLATRGRGTGSKEDGATNIRPSGAEQDFLPEGWTKAVDEQSGHIYYYSDTSSTWAKPSTPAACLVRDGVGKGGRGTWNIAESMGFSASSPNVEAASVPADRIPSSAVQMTSTPPKAKTTMIVDKDFLSDGIHIEANTPASYRCESVLSEEDEEEAPSPLPTVATYAGGGQESGGAEDDPHTCALGTPQTAPTRSKITRQGRHDPSGEASEQVDGTSSLSRRVVNSERVVDNLHPSRETSSSTHGDAPSLQGMPGTIFASTNVPPGTACASSVALRDEDDDHDIIPESGNAEIRCETSRTPDNDGVRCESGGGGTLRVVCPPEEATKKRFGMTELSLEQTELAMAELLQKLGIDKARPPAAEPCSNSSDIRNVEADHIFLKRVHRAVESGKNSPEEGERNGNGDRAGTGLYEDDFDDDQ